MFPLLIILLGLDPQPPPPVPRPQPVIAADDVRSDAPDARDVFEPWGAYGHIWGAAPGGDAELVSWQLGLGPVSDLGSLSDYALRVRGTILSSTAETDVGPLTVGLQHLFLLGSLSVAPLLDVHLGIEAAVSTPWLSGRTFVPPPALRAMNAVDTELSENGWSLRPLGTYLRGDLLACRNVYAEAGASPEVFVPTLHGQPNELDLRWHAGVGFSFACKHSADSFFHHLVAAFEFRGRARLYAGDEAPSHHATTSAALQLDEGPVTIGAFLIVDTANPTADWSSLEKTVGVRLQVGIGQRTED
jgi:hypothetical protein